jgi:hypothetical protein
MSWILLKVSNFPLHLPVLGMQGNVNHPQVVDRKWQRNFTNGQGTDPEKQEIGHIPQNILVRRKKMLQWYHTSIFLRMHQLNNKTRLHYIDVDWKQEM